MRRRGSSLISVIALVIVLWIILDRLRIVIWVNVPWWGFLLLVLVLFLVVDYVLGRLVNRT